MPIPEPVFDWVERLLVENQALRTILKHHGLWDEAELENAVSQVQPRFAPLFAELRRQADDPLQLAQFVAQVIAGRRNPQ